MVIIKSKMRDNLIVIRDEKKGIHMKKGRILHIHTDLPRMPHNNSSTVIDLHSGG